MKTKIFSFVAATIAIGFVACNNDGDSTSATDSTTTTDVTTTTASGNYAAQADSFRINSEAGYYLNARTGKPIRIKVDASTGARINEETNEPVDYYVDKRTWWVYGDDSWDTIGTAHMEGEELRYLDDNDKWVTFDEKWKMEDGDSKMKSGDSKTKTEKDGDSKTKSGDTKVKTDEDGTKVKN